MATFLELQDEALHDDFEPTKYRTLTKRWLNDAQRRLARKLHIRSEEQVTTYTLAGGAAMTLPSDFIRLKSVYLFTNLSTSDGYNLEEVDVRELDSLVSGTGDPIGFALAGNELLVWPTPQSGTQIAVRYWKAPPTLVADADVPQIPEDYHHLLVTFARARLFRAEDDLQLYNAYLADWERDMQQAAGELQSETRTKSRQIPGLYGV